MSRQERYSTLAPAVAAAVHGDQQLKLAVIVTEGCSRFCGSGSLKKTTPHAESQDSYFFRGSWKYAAAPAFSVQKTVHLSRCVMQCGCVLSHLSTLRSGHLSLSRAQPALDCQLAGG